MAETNLFDQYADGPEWGALKQWHKKLIAKDADRSLQAELRRCRTPEKVLASAAGAVPVLVISRWRTRTAEPSRRVTTLIVTGRTWWRSSTTPSVVLGRSPGRWNPATHSQRLCRDWPSISSSKVCSGPPWCMARTR